jgi:cobyrinic acid a,c-diamide synthase
VVSAAPPRIVVAGTRSGVGKTTVATGLMAALARRGLRVSGHKVGPDFIDPGYHALACHRPPRNLDTVLHGAHRIAPLLRHGAAGAEIAVVEGVMGLFDGRGSGDEASTAQVARLLDAPVLLVVDASAASRSVAAEVLGFTRFDRTIRVGGVVLNRVGSDHHERLLREALAPLGVPVVGVLRRHDAVATPSRHLGLVPAAERAPQARTMVAALADLVTDTVDLAAVRELAASAGPLPGPAWCPDGEVGDPVPGAPVVAVSGGSAFTFVYQEHRELLAAAGAEVATVDPLADGALPPGTRAVYLGGGFPEVYAAELAANAGLAAAVRAHAAAGGAVVAECGGLLYLCRSLDGHRMVGLLDATAVMTDRLVLGYRDAVSASPGPLGPAGVTATGHEFHRTAVAPRAGGRPAWRLSRPGGAPGSGQPEGFVAGIDFPPASRCDAPPPPNVHASYLHAGWVGAPRLAAGLVAAAARVALREVAR